MEVNKSTAGDSNNTPAPPGIAAVPSAEEKKKISRGTTGSTESSTDSPALGAAKRAEKDDEPPMAG